MIWFLWTYFTGLIFFALKLAYVIRYQLDSFDWDYHKDDIWLRYVMAIIFWPLACLITPGILLNAKKYFVFDMMFGSIRISGIGDKMRRLHQLAVNPPPCSSTIYFCYEEAGGACGLWFEVDDLVTFYKNKELPLSSSYEAEALITWVENRDSESYQATEVPDQINFENIAMSLLAAGIGRIECKDCNSSYSASDLSSKKELIHRGWNYDTYSCPQGHIILKHNYAHFNMGR